MIVSRLLTLQLKPKIRKNFLFQRQLVVYQTGLSAIVNDKRTSHNRGFSIDGKCLLKEYRPWKFWQFVTCLFYRLNLYSFIFCFRYSSLPFTKNPEKYIKYTVEEVEAMLKSFFDVSAWWLRVCFVCFLLCLFVCMFVFFNQENFPLYKKKDRSIL